jgi:hypothetical protein
MVQVASSDLLRPLGDQRRQIEGAVAVDSIGEGVTDHDVVKDLQTLADLMSRYKNRIFLEDEKGWKFEMLKAKVVGTRTDDPGLVLSIETWEY